MRALPRRGLGQRQVHGRALPRGRQAARKRLADLDAGRSEYITLLIYRGTIEWFKAQMGEDGDIGGTKWLTLAEKALQEHARWQAGVSQKSRLPAPSLATCSASTIFAGPVDFSCRSTSCSRPRCWATPVR